MSPMEIPASQAQGWRWIWKGQKKDRGVRAGPASVTLSTRYRLSEQVMVPVVHTGWSQVATSWT